MNVASPIPLRVVETASTIAKAPDRLRVVHLLNELAQLGNGIVNVAIDTAIEHARAGHDVTVAAPDGAYAELLRENGVKHLLLEPSGALGPFTATARLRRFLVRNETQIVHAHMMKGAVIGRLATAGTKARLVTTVHNSWQRHANIMRLGHRVIAVSDAVRNDMISRGVPASRIETVLNGTIGTARRPAGTPPVPVTLEHPNVVTVAGMYVRKGIGDLIEATVMIRERVPTVKMYLLGDGPDRAHFEQFARDRGVSASVVFLGFRADAELVMKQADVFVLASHADPNPLVIPEARAAGLPIVATRVDGIPESLDGGDAGLLVPPHAPDALANAIAGLLLSPEQRDRLRVATSRNLERLTVRRMAGETLDVYRRAAAGALA